MADTATETENQNTVTIEDAGPSRKKLKIEIPAETVDEKLRESLDLMAVEAQLPGFRKGRAPRRLIERRFGATIKSEAKSQLISSAYSRAVEDNALKVLGDPIADGIADVELETGKPLAFEIEVEVLPEFELPSLEGIKVRKPTLQVTDEMVDEEIKKILINEGDLEERDTPEQGDYLTGHGVMVDADGNKHYDIPGAVVQVPGEDSAGRGMILGVMVDDFATQLGVPKPGETATIKTKGPENHEVEAIRGADLTITFEVQRVDRILPATLEEVVAKFGMDSENELRDAVRTRLNQRVIIRQQTALRQQVARHLLKETKVDLPERLTTRQAARTLENRRMELMYRGVDPQKIEEHMAELRAASGNEAVRELKLFFILNKAADTLEIRVDESEINGRIAQIAAERGERPERLRQQLIENNQINVVFQQIREHKTMDAILAKAEIEELDAEQFDKLMREEAKAAGETAQPD